jgi:hypothetical protein
MCLRLVETILTASVKEKSKYHYHLYGSASKT